MTRTAGPGSAAPAPGPSPGLAAPGCGWLLVVLVACCAVFGGYRGVRELTRPPAMDDGIFGLIARNHVKYGYPGLGFVQIATPGPPVPAWRRAQYQTHPPLTSIVSSLGIAAFGPTVWANRLPHLLCGVGAVVAMCFLAARLYGPEAGLWTCAVGGLLPAMCRFLGSSPCPIGSTLFLWQTLAALGYLAYARSGRRFHFIAMVAAALLAAMTDWPGHILCFALASHALVYRTRADRRLMLVLPGLSLALFCGLFAYARALPPERIRFGTLDGEFAHWALGLDLAVWARDFVRKFVLLYTPLGVCAAVWLAWSARRDVFTRAHRPSQHLLLLWGLGVPYVVLFRRAFLAHETFHLVFAPAVVVTLGVLAARVWGGPSARFVRLRRLALVAMLFFTASWANCVVQRRASVDGLRGRYVPWARDLAAHAAAGGPVAFALHYAYPMQYLADLVVEEQVDSLEKLDALADESGGVGELFVPMAYPLGEAGLGAELLATRPVRAAGSLLSFAAARGSPAVVGPADRVGPAELEGGLMVRRVAFAPFRAVGGSEFLYVGAELDRLPEQVPGGTVCWEFRFCDADGAAARSLATPARTSASYFVAVPPGWSWERGRVEMRLLDGRPARAGGLAARAARVALRVVSLGLWGAPGVQVRAIGLQGGPPIVLEAKPPAAARDGQLEGS